MKYIILRNEMAKGLKSFAALRICLNFAVEKFKKVYLGY